MLFMILCAITHRLALVLYPPQHARLAPVIASPSSGERNVERYWEARSQMLSTSSLGIN